ncbi:TPA: recombinase RecT [Vibrio parahaemolyticus]
MNIFKTAINEIEQDYRMIVALNEFNHLDFDVESKLALRIVENSTGGRFPLDKVEPSSVAHALFNAGALGVSLSPAVDHAIIGGEITESSGRAICRLHLTYKGLLHLCYEAGAISHVTTWVIHEKDKVRLSNDITSKPQVDIEDMFGDRGPVVGALCTICVPNGDYITTKMTADELNQVAVMSGNDAWFGPFADEFRKKQVLKRALHSMASTYHGRLSRAAKFLSESDMDLYERTERKSIPVPKNQQLSVKQSTSHQTRGEAAFRREKDKNEEKIEPFQFNNQSTGLYLN